MIMDNYSPVRGESDVRDIVGGVADDSDKR